VADDVHTMAAVQVPPRLLHVQAALHPLHRAPTGPGWNRQELTGLLRPDAILREAAVLVGLIERADGWYVLFTRRTDDLRQHAGQVSFPGGTVDAGDAGPLSAALREAEEEIGLSPTQVHPFGYLDPMTTITGYRVLPVVAHVAADFVPVPHPAEVAAVFEVELDFLLDPGNLHQISGEAGGQVRHVLEFAEYPGAPGQRIWGATAAIVFNLRQRLQAAATGGGGGA